MIFTSAQQTIIRELCSIEFQTLEGILIKPVLGDLDEDFTIEEILMMHGCTREDYDKELLDAYKQFQLLHDNPDTLFNLGHYEILIFIQVLHLLEDQWMDRFPNALINLWNKIFIWETSNEIHSKN